MKRKELLTTSLSFGGLLFVLNEVATYLNLFWSLWWLDLAFHFVGGFAVGSLAIGLFVARNQTFWKAARTVFLSTLLVALLWEVYEFVLRDVYTEDYFVDASTDIVLGLAGGLLALFFVPRNLWEIRGAFTRREERIAGE